MLLKIFLRKLRKLEKGILRIGVHIPKLNDTARKSTISLPIMLKWLGIYKNLTFEPCVCRLKSLDFIRIIKGEVPALKEM